ncbi:MAG: recombinase family protein [Pseudobdellovibrio sp.]
MSTNAAAYGRVSTLLGQDVENQLVGIRELCLNRKFTLIGEYVDEGISGKSERRPSLDRLIRDARLGRFKILVIYSIDRLGRSTKHLLNLIDELKHCGVSIISIRENLDFSSPTGQMALTMISAVAQLEAELISERIRTSLAVKKALASKLKNGWKCGRPPISEETKKKVLQLRDQGLSIRKIASTLGNLSKTSVEKILKD